MVISTDQFMIRSKNANMIYWEQGFYPEWTALNTLRHFPIDVGIPGTGVEPHYHDCDELWLFTAGRGEVWLDDTIYEISPNTLVYTPMGCVHRFQMFTPYENNAIITKLERAQRATHIMVEDHGLPVPTVSGFIVPGASNTGPFPAPGPRCPLSEWRMITLNEGDTVEETTLMSNEHWLVMSGAIQLHVDTLEIVLTTEDVGLLRTGVKRHIRAVLNTRLIVAREH